ncbi:hypothetical protein CANARDRAFT_27320 [[Candida] arabinofermentans NRRL YB-2248]|uniref:Uncharacterized protein n=1 Tax=[Candida] arabinofermentans NRRL YB-2248 TaxID=983967 RepID=A0A1E4T5F0_9ASCO|nr:hypothetical protein CANARDRAFT_27320 [[Candida] arabinofermentans NRRL YB-2248]
MNEPISITATLHLSLNLSTMLPVIFEKKIKHFAYHLDDEKFDMVLLLIICYPFLIVTSLKEALAYIPLIPLFMTTYMYSQSPPTQNSW